MKLHLSCYRETTSMQITQLVILLTSWREAWDTLLRSFIKALDFRGLRLKILCRFGSKFFLCFMPGHFDTIVFFNLGCESDNLTN